jgi:hypothetical protein
MPILGLPMDAWILLLVSVGLGLGLEIAFLRAQKRYSTARDDRAGAVQHDSVDVT